MHSHVITALLIVSASIASIVGAPVEPLEADVDVPDTNVTTVTEAPVAFLQVTGMKTGSCAEQCASEFITMHHIERSPQEQKDESLKCIKRCRATAK
ncbi:unnamed protein product [Cylicocyclus nassatus]|uniref:Uncharacterized protein n=1 Tax=Cylicocyclus nassatus TaxID=53992 RepID=A0AA36H2Y2_CYLNA|nr:unnamed protein product [Cylicocyclus nassatus]